MTPTTFFKFYMPATVFPCVHSFDNVLSDKMSGIRPFKVCVTLVSKSIANCYNLTSTLAWVSLVYPMAALQEKPDKYFPLSVSLPRQTLGAQLPILCIVYTKILQDRNMLISKNFKELFYTLHIPGYDSIHQYYYKGED